MSSSSATARSGSAARGGRGEVIALLDSDEEDDGGPPPPPPASATAARASPSTTNGTAAGGRRGAPPVPFRLYETTTARSEFWTRHDAGEYFGTLRGMIGLDEPRRKHQWLFVFNFLIDFSYLLDRLLPEILQFHRVVVFYGSASDAGAMERWRRLLAGSGNTVEFVPLIPSDPPRSRTNPLPFRVPYGVHHTKMFLAGYEQGGRSHCRVVVHTANLLEGDIEYKTQGAYCQDFPLKKNKDGEGLPNENEAGKGNRKIPVVNPYKRKRDESISKQKNQTAERGWPFDEEEENVAFEEDLVTYLESYRYFTRQSWCSASSSGLSDKPMSWLQLIRKYDYSSAYAVLIPSAPGRHKPADYHNFGYLKLRKAIIDWVCPHLQNTKQSSSEPLLCQFSSIGSLNETWLNQFLSAVNSSSTENFDPINNNLAGKKGKKKLPPLSSRMKIVWPTVDEIRRSVEGYQGGGSVPGKVQNLSKEFLRPLYHRWSRRNARGSDSDPLRTARHIPHIKTFVRPSSSDPDGIDWLVLTSHNLSIAAWGQLQRRDADAAPGDKVLFVRHWELGAFVSPATLASAVPNAVGDGVRMAPYTGVSGGHGVINLDSDDEDKEDDPRVLVPLPFPMDPTPYGSDDIAWAVDRSCPVPDAFGCIIP